MSLDLQDGRREAARDLMERFGAEAYGWDVAQELPEAALRFCAERGYFDPNPRDGTLSGVDQLRERFEALGALSASLGSVVNVQHMVIDALVRAGGIEGRGLDALLAGADIASFCCTEEQAGSDLAAIETRLEPVKGGYVLRGRKRWITTATRATVFLVFAKLDGAPTACLVKRNAPGLTITPVRDLLGLRAAHLGDLDFECEIAAEDIVGAPGFALNVVGAQGLLRGRLNVAWMACGMLHAVLERTARWVSGRHAFGNRLMDLGQVRAALTRMSVDLQAARALTAQAAEAFVSRTPGMSEVVLAAKYFCCRAAAEHTAVAVRLHGARGCHEPNDIARHYRDARIFEVIEGASEVLESLLGDGLAKRYARAP